MSVEIGCWLSERYNAALVYGKLVAQRFNVFGIVDHHPFRFLNPVTGKCMRARYVAERRVIECSYENGKLSDHPRYARGRIENSPIVVIRSRDGRVRITRLE